MKQAKNMKIPALLTLVLGALAMAARAGLFYSGMDERRLLIPGQPLQWCYWLLAAAAIAVACFWGLRMPREHIPAPTGLVPGFIQIFMGILVAGEVLFWDQFLIVRLTGAAVSVVALLEGISRLRKRKVTVLGHGLLCSWLCLYLIFSYRSWSANPQAEMYLTPALALFLFLLLSYELAAWDLGKESPRKLAVLTVLTGFFCLSVEMGPEARLLHVAGAVSFLYAMEGLNSRSGE